jgi:hypothetical protein
MKIFVSTPSDDLKDIRKIICETLEEQDITPLSMEKLYASPMPPWNELTKQIDQANYLLLIVGDKYGSKDTEGIGYTEKEFNYAEKRDIPILAFLKEFDKKDENNSTELTIFKSKVSDEEKRTVSFWTNKDEIRPLVIKVLKEIKSEKETIHNNKIFEKNTSKNDSDSKETKSVELERFYPDYPTRPVGSCAITFKKRELSDIIISFNHTKIMDIFKILDCQGSLETVGYDEDRVICQIDSFRLYLEQNEKIALEQTFIEYKNKYLSSLKEMATFLQTDDFSISNKGGFSYRIIKVSYEFWKLLLDFSEEHDFLNKDGNWDMFSPNPSALHITHSIICKNLNYDGMMHAFFTAENDDEIGNEYVWLVLNLEMTKDDSSGLQCYSKRKIWGCKTAYDWCVNELFPEVHKRYGYDKSNSYEEKRSYKKNDVRSKINELQMFVLENGMKLSQQEVKSIQEALKYCLSTKILPTNEYSYIISKLGLNFESLDKKDSRTISEEIVSKVKIKWANVNLTVDADHLMRCINAYTDGYSKSALSEDEVYNIYHILKCMIERMDEIKFIEKYRDFYS